MPLLTFPAIGIASLRYSGRPNHVLSALDIHRHRILLSFNIPPLIILEISQTCRIEAVGR